MFYLVIIENEYKKYEGSDSIMKVLVSGANGFIGKHLVVSLVESGFDVTAILRRPCDALPTEVKRVVVSNLDCMEFAGLEPFDVFVHAAAISSSRKRTNLDIIDANVHLTRSFAEYCLRVGVKRFIFLSTVKVFGESTSAGKPFVEGGEERPTDPYACSKLMAEAEIKSMLEGTGTKYVIIRSPIVYGPGVKGNFNAILRLAATKLPLPFGSIDNARSMIYVENLVSFIQLVMHKPEALNRVFLPADSTCVSTTKLITILRQEMELPLRLVPVPKFILLLLSKLFKSTGLVDRLFGSLEIDTTSTFKTLNWTPPYSVEQGVSFTVRGRNQND